MPEAMLDAFSKVNEETDQPHLHTCTVVVGDGTMKVDFKNGRAKVPARFAALVALDERIEIPGLGMAIATAAAPPVEAVELAAVPDAPIPSSVLEQATAEYVAAAPGDEAALARFLAAVNAAKGPAASATDSADAARAKAVADAAEYLRQEGEEVPAPAASTPASTDLEYAPNADARPPAENPNLDAETADGQLRCQSVKADGSQCSNAAVDGTGHCNLPKHRATAA